MTRDGYQEAVLARLDTITDDVAYLRKRQDEMSEVMTTLRITVGQNQVKHSVAKWTVSTIVPAFITFVILGLNKLLGW